MANNKIAYGLAKKHGIDTDGMAPKQVWDALGKKGIDVSKEAQSEKSEEMGLHSDWEEDHAFEDFFDDKKESGVSNADSVKDGSQSGAQSGALNSDSKEALKHAKTYYEEIRKRTTDIKAIANNTGISEADIEKVKRHVFIDKHELAEGVKHFDPSYDMAQSWQRLSEGKNIQPHDITLLKHELEEQRIMQNEKVDYKTAHDKANLKYDYDSEMKESKKEKNNV